MSTTLLKLLSVIISFILFSTQQMYAREISITTNKTPSQVNIIINDKTIKPQDISANINDKGEIVIGAKNPHDKIITSKKNNKIKSQKSIKINPITKDNYKLIKIIKDGKLVIQTVKDNKKPIKKVNQSIGTKNKTEKQTADPKKTVTLKEKKDNKKAVNSHTKLSKLSEQVHKDKVKPANDKKQVVEKSALQALPVAGAQQKIDNMTSTTIISPPPPTQINIITNENGNYINFPVKQNVSSAAFFYNDYLWIVFDQKQQDWQFNNPSQSSNIKFIRKIPHETASIFIFELTQKDHKVILNIAADNMWQLQVLKNKSSRLPNKYSDEYYVTANHLFVGLQNTTSKITLKDTESTQDLVIFTANKINERTIPLHQYIDLTILKSPQGVSFLKISDEAKFIQNAAGIKIIAPSEEKLARNYQVKYDDNSNYYKFLNWRKTTDNSFHSDISKIMENIILALPTDQNAQRMQLARYYFANGLYSEVSTILQSISVEDPTIFTSSDYTLLKAANSYLQGRYIEAYNIFSNINIKNLPIAYQKEIEYWRGANNVALGDEDEKNFDSLRAEKDFLSSYPNELRWMFLLREAQFRYEENDPDTAKIIVKKVLNEKPSKTYLNKALYVEAVILQKSNYKKAISNLEKLADDILDNKYRTRAIMLMTKLKFEHKEITIDQALKQLEKVMNSWRGGKTEVNLLEVYGDLSIKAGYYTQGMRAWKTAVTHMPNSADGLLIASNLSKTFVDVLTDKLPVSEFDALAIYYEFKELTPIGTLGDEVITSLLNKLIKVDLLEQAVTLLNYQINHEEDDLSREKMINTLMEVNFKYRKPQQVLDNLKLSDLDVLLPDDLIKNRRYLQASAMVELEQYKTALEMLAEDNSEKGTSIKAQAMWNSKSWPELSSMLTNYIRSLRSLPSELSAQEESFVMQLAVSYSFIENFEAIKTLLRDFGSRMQKDSIYLKTLNYLASNNTPMNIDDLKDLDLNGLRNYPTK